LKDRGLSMATAEERSTARRPGSRRGAWLATVLARAPHGGRSRRTLRWDGPGFVPTAPDRFLTPLAIEASAAAAMVILYASAMGSSIGHPSLGYDFLAYLAAGQRLLAGQPLYDLQQTAPGPFGLYLYPPPFALLMVPLALVPQTLAVALWLGALAVAFVVAIAILPTSPRVRALTLLVAGTSWPVLYGWRIGQPGMLLLLLGAVGWRYLDRPWLLGGSTALGVLAKVQPGAVFLWALLVGRWPALVRGLVVGVSLAAVSAVLLGPVVWLDYGRLIVGTAASADTTPHNFAPGALAYAAGAPEPVARAIELATMAGAATALVVAARRGGPAAGYLAALVAGQLFSPLLWDHYAVLLVLPVAYLLERGRRWAAVLLPALWLPWPILYPVSFFLVLLALATDSGAPGVAGPLSAQPSGRRGILGT
jgi:hypothetical protein